MALPEFEHLRLALERKAAKMLSEMPEAERDSLDSMVPRRPGTTESDLRQLESVLARPLPRSFSRVMRSYELAGLELAGVIFGGSSATFGGFLAQQVADPQLTWGVWIPTDGLLVIGASSGHVAFGSAIDGSVSACARDHPLEERRRVAADLDVFLRALASLTLLEQVEDDLGLATRLAEDVGAPTATPYWLSRIQGHG